MLAPPPLRRSFSDEPSPGTCHFLGVLPKRARDNSPCKSPVTKTTQNTSDNRDSALNELSPYPTLPLSPILSNGNPLKSSLKSSTSFPRTPHRTHSEPPTTKHVHFPVKDDALATIHVYHRSAHPAALCSPTNGNDNMTCAEVQDFPTRFPSSVLNYEVDPTKSSPIPLNPSPFAHLHLEALNLSSYSPTSTTMIPPLLTGSVLVRNLAFEKHVAIRYTLDDWQTINEIGAHYVDSLSLLPSQMLPSRFSPTTSDTVHQRGRGWDRFAFMIHLENTHWFTRTLWLAARYRIDSTYPEPGSSQYGPGNEWWDNNGGKNYRVGFIATPRSLQSISHPGTVSDVNEERRSTLYHTKEVNLCNYVPLQNCTPSVLYTSTSSLLPSTEDGSASPASSTLSTPTGSPTVDGSSTTSTYDSRENRAITPGLGYIAGWDWAAPTAEPTSEEVSCPRVGLRHSISSPQRTETLHDSTSLYTTFVSKWCFAQGPSTSCYAYDGGMMA